jgi:hypothetical protein
VTTAATPEPLYALPLMLGLVAWRKVREQRPETRGHSGN